MFAPNSFRRNDTETADASPIEVRELQYRRIEVAVVHEPRRSIDRRGKRLCDARARKSDSAPASGDCRSSLRAPLRRATPTPRRVITLTVPPKASAPNSDDPGAVQDLDTLHGVERHRDVAVMVAGLLIVQPHAVHEHEHLAETGAAHGEVALNTPLAPGPHVDRRKQPQHVGDRIHRQRGNLLAGDDGHRPGHAAEFHRRRRSSHDDRLPISILGRCRR